MGGFSAAARNWFTGAFRSPTDAQQQAWEAIMSGNDALVVAPTGSGKTLAAFFWALDRLASQPDKGAASDAEDETVNGVKVLYISPLKALGVDVERNLRAPLAGLREASRALGLEAPDITVGVRSGDTTPAERRRLLTNPPDILITTPESLYLLLTSKGAETLRTVDTVIVDEVHAVAGNKRGAHLALSLERLDQILPKPAQRIGLSATVEPTDEVARFLGGAKPVTVVKPDTVKRFDITVEVPVEDMANPPVPEPDVIDANAAGGEHRLGSMWPSIEKSLYTRILQAQSTIVFTNSRRLAERLTARLNQIHEEALYEAGQSDVDSSADTPPRRIAGLSRDDTLTSLDQDMPVLARAHHGSVSKEARAQVEEDLKSGRLRCVVATASLELGIDMGEVDLVIQIDPPPSVSSGMQRLGRSGHQVDGASTAVFYPTHRSKLLETVIIAERMKSGQIETLRVLSNPLDVLAQQTIAHTVAGPLDVDEWFTTVRRAAPYADLPRSAYLSVLDLISGKFPSTEFSSLRARVDWDRTANLLTARPGAQRLAVTNGGTIPDRGQYRVVAGSPEEGGTRVGELDEEMVYETRVGEVFTLGTTPWRVRRITKDTVEVEPAFGVIAKTPFWRGDAPSRPVELGRALGDLIEDLTPTATVAKSSGEGDSARERLQRAGLDDFAIANTLNYLSEQSEATGQVASATSLVVERTRDDVGDWLLILQSPLGLAVHAPWALAIDSRLRDRWGLESKSIPSNDGIIVRLPDFDSVDSDLGGFGAGEGMPSAADIFLFEANEIVDIVQSEVENSAVFAARFREAAARALILGSSKPGKRSPLWQQRLRASTLLEVASRYPDFPIILEGLREVLQDVYDTSALRRLMEDLATRRVSMSEVTTDLPSPFARSLLFGYVGEFIYAGDTPAGERRIAALSVDPQVLRELLGEVPLSDLLEADAVEEVEAELQRTKPGWQATGDDGLVDLLRALGPLTLPEIVERIRLDSPGSLEEAETIVSRIVSARNAFRTRIRGEEYVAATEDAGLLVETAGIVPPPGIPAAFLDAPAEPNRDLLLRHLSSSGPTTTQQVAERFGLAPVTVETTLRHLQDQGEVLHGLFLPEELAASRNVQRNQPQWVATRVLDRMRTRSLAILRGTVEPVSPEVFATFLGQWQYCGGRLRGVDGLYTALEQLARFPLPASAWETLVLPQRVADYQESFLDELVTNGEVTWVGSAPIGSKDGWIQFVPAGVPARSTVGEERPRTPLEEAILGELANRGALFAPAIHEGVVSAGHAATWSDLAQAMWALVWDGSITSDSVGALRAHVRGTKSAQKTSRHRPRSRAVSRRGFAGVSRQSAQSSSVPPSLVGRWSLVAQPAVPPNSDAVGTLWAVEMLERYGVVTRGSVSLEAFPGGFSQAYNLYREFELSGTCRRGYFIQGLGGAQFAIPGAVDQLRTTGEDQQQDQETHYAVTLASTDPANPFGASLSWPDNLGAGTAIAKRNPGAMVSIVDGSPLIYLERGGRTALVKEDADQEVMEAACQSLVATARRAPLATFTIERINGLSPRESKWWPVLLAAGFSEVPRGATLRRQIR